MLKLAAVLIIVIGVLSRLLPHPDNFAPITALALFGGVYLPWKFAFLPLLALFISDLFIGFYGITMLYVYGSFALVGLIGWWLRDHKKFGIVILASLLSSVLFYLITNFGVWASPNSWYTRDLNGLLQSYINAVPFFRGTLLGDLSYTGIFFGCFELAKILGRKFLTSKAFNLIF